MAIYLAERSIDAVVAALQSNLGTALSAIDTEKADGITLAVPATGSYYKRPKAEIAGAPSHVEVFEESFAPFDFTIDQAANRVTYQIPITVRVTFFNTIAETADSMMKRMRRYGAAVVRVFLANPRLAGTDDAIQGVAVMRVVPFWETDPQDENKVIKVRTAVGVAVRCEEVGA